MVVHRHTVRDGVHGHGIALGKTGQKIPFAIGYDMVLTADWRIKEVSIKSLLDERVINLLHKDYQWYDRGGLLLSEFDGIEFVDISVSPFTNTLLIKNLYFEDDLP